MCKFCNGEEKEQLHLFFFFVACDANLWTNIQNVLKPLNIHFKFSLLKIYVSDSGWKLSSDIEYNYSVS